MMTTDEIEDVLLRARLRRERRLAAVMALRDGFPRPAVWRALDLVHEATRLIDNLDTHAAAIADIELSRAQDQHDRIWDTP
jgi:hypothetical protein